MNALLRVPYEFAWRAANIVAPLVPSSGNKIARTLRSRVNLHAKIDAWAGAHRDPSRQLLWMHASSVGESLQALPVLKLFRERNRELQIVFTFYSPSAESTAQKFPVDFTSYLPFDTAASMAHVVETLRPSALIFSKLDVWPILVAEAKRAGVPVGITSGTVHRDSSRRSRLASLLLRDAYSLIDSIGATSEEDRANIIQLGALPDRIVVTGDTRYDQVWARRQSREPVELLEHLQSNRPTIVAGSTWQSDEKPLFKAFLHVRSKHQRIRLIIAPHEPAAATIVTITSWANSQSLTVATIDDAGAVSADVVIVDRIGVLGDLYALADVAYVGGGFHRAGLHSLLEPAAFGKPVVFGGITAPTRDASSLITCGGGKSVTSASELSSVLSHLINDSRDRLSAGAAAQKMVEKGLGAAELSYGLVRALVARGRPNAW